MGALNTPERLASALGAAPSYSARAWVNWNGTGTVAIRDSDNVSSITDSGVGIYVVNFIIAMPSANYAAIAGGNPYFQWVNSGKTASAATVQTRNSAHANTDFDDCAFLAFI